MTVKPVIYGGAVARAMKVPATANLVTGLGHVFVSKGLTDRAVRLALIQAYRIALRHPNSLTIFQNPDDRSLFVNLGVVDEDRTRIVRGSGVALDRFVQSPEPEGPLLVLLPARLIWEKGVDTFVDAAREIKKDLPAVRFALVGDSQPSNSRSVPLAVLEGWRREGVVEWWGRRTDMPQALAEAHIICLPSRYGEGVPKVLIEAAASGRPIVTTDIAGCREIVREGENGTLVPGDDKTALVAALRRLLGDSEIRSAYGRRGREIAENEFSEELVERQTVAIFRELLESAERKSAAKRNSC